MLPHKDNLLIGYEAAQLGLPLGLGAAAGEVGFYKGCFLFTKEKEVKQPETAGKLRKS